MKAVILAAGVGSRLKALTGEKPKCMVRVNGKCMIDYQVDALLAAGVSCIHVVVGFQADRLIAHLRSRYPGDARIEYVVNSDFATTNNMYSLSLCAPKVADGPFLLMNADVVFDASIIRDLMAVDGSAICVDVGAYNEESMKVVLSSAGDVIGGIAKTFGRAEALGSSIDVYRLDKAGARAVFDTVHEIVVARGRRNDWTEVALDEMMRTGRLSMRPFDIKGRKWYEIDNLDDLRQAETIFAREQIDWRRYKVGFVDMDGTLYKGSEPFAGVDHFVRELRHRLDVVYFLSNNSSKAHDQYVQRLGSIGVDARVDDVVLSSDALGASLRDRGIDRVFLVGTSALGRVLSTYGVLHDARDPQAVVLGYDTELTYEKLRDASYLLHRADIPYFATHLDVVCPTERGDIPDIGAMVALLERTTKRRPDESFGKPQPSMVSFLLERHGVTGRECIFFGDRVYTDYAMARACGATFVGVLSGEATRADYEGLDEIFVVPTVSDLFAVHPGVDAPQGALLSPLRPAVAR
jgi:HAD superfamily hydrolase (TIGR01450 family)